METTMNAIPAHSRLPVRNQTTKAIIAPGSMKSSTFAMRTIITKPMMTRRNKKRSSYRVGNPGRFITGIKLTRKWLSFKLYLYLLLELFVRRR
jgi:hypothetical protein